jgi:hypothetical protein
MDMKFRKLLAQIQNVQIQICTFSKTSNITQKINMYPYETIPLKGPSEARAARMAVRALTDDEKSELREQFTNIDKDESGYVIILIHNKGTVTFFSRE